MRFEFVALLCACLAMFVGFIRQPQRRARRFILAALVAALVIAGNADASGCRGCQSGNGNKNGPIRNLVSRVVSVIIPNRSSSASASCSAATQPASGSRSAASLVVNDSPLGVTFTTSSCPGGVGPLIR